ncbi:choloylglycine hydrolase [Chromobacterium phragmitis]|uniref:Choloylglycine hydrolase n=1 Tax=Chromobacterium phragmitis TaxID=2202141 RepID=A0A344UIX9_9NEIS|nr:linear amide C-N hydrolase [Chromobacterium phragmitis]AXE29836.1 choloylglycine hydrolase [Chromobacterium phragmitis]AXE35227.1 choloylglycine hydrolase [Chromobacterium phragmitis]
MKRKTALHGLLISSTASLALWSPIADACTRALWNTNQQAVVASRSMDWSESTQPRLLILPRGMARDGGKLGPATVVKDNAARWTSQYGSVVTSAYGVGAVDGVNEKGLAMHLLFLTATDYGAREPGKQGVQAGLWGQYLLDNAATVSEALQAMQAIQPVMVEYAGFKSSLHLAIEDASGDSALIQYIDGKPHIYHGREYRVLTNDPPYERQLAELKKRDFSQATRETPLPGNVNPVDRFIRASYFLDTLREPQTQRQAVASILSIARNVSVPFNAPYKTPGATYDTEYRTVADLTNKQYFFELASSPSLLRVDLDKIDFSGGQVAHILNPDQEGLAGEVNDRFQPLAKALF